MIAEVAGWGKTEHGNTSRQLLDGELQLVPLDECQRKYISKVTITRQQICARTKDGELEATDTCDGDSGGPLMQYDHNLLDYIQTGIISFGPECGHTTMPGVYTRVQYFIDWINYVTNQ